MSTSIKIKQIPFTCTYNCGSRCELLAHIKDDQLIRIDTTRKKEDSILKPHLIPCVKGRALRRSLSDPKRIKTPLRRIGPRGSGNFTEISWNEALDKVAGELERIRTEYGGEAIFHAYGDGSLGGRGFSGVSASYRFFSYWAPVTDVWGGMSNHSIRKASNWMLGEVIQSSDRVTLLDSKLIILWGNNLAETRMGSNTNYYIAEAKERGARLILIDPRYTDSGIFADQWIPIKPGTDPALAASIAYIMETEGLIDYEFIKTHTTGYIEYKQYLLGETDNIPKTPIWASKITGVEEDTIWNLAHDYAMIKPAALLAGWGHQRTIYGEQSSRSLITLACMSGNVGIRGGGFAGIGIRWNIIPIESLPIGPYKPVFRLNSTTWGSEILDNNLEPPIKMAYIIADNLINKTPDLNRNIQALKQLDFIVVQDPFLTPTAKLADIVLPICTDLERTDIVTSWGYDLHLFYSQQSVDKIGESRTDYWVFSELAKRLGFFEVYTEGRTEEDWINYLLRKSNLDTRVLEREGVLRLDAEPRVALSEFRDDPSTHALKTSSGLIEIICPEAEKAGLPSIPSYVEASIGSEEYPLQLLTPHSRIRSHSCLHSNPWLQRLEPHTVWISSRDAVAREIHNGELVEVVSKAGKIRIPAMVTERIMPGVVCIYHGTWYDPASDGVDEGGCVNTLTSHITSATGGYATHSNWVEVRRIIE